MSSAVSTTSRMRMRPPHLRQRVSSRANTRARSLAHPRRRERGEDSVSSSGLSLAEPARPSARCCPGGDDGHFGVGLALVRSLCEALGWMIAAENRSDGSLAFVVRAAPDLRAVR